MLQTRLHKYTTCKSGIFYYVRRVPKRVSNHYRLPLVRISLRTRNAEIAQKRASKINAELERDWEQLMFSSVGGLVQSFRIPAKPQFSNSNLTTNSAEAPSIQEALEFYFSAQGGDRRKEFFSACRRAVLYLTEATGNWPITSYTRKEANLFRDYLLQQRKVTPTSAKRIISSVRAIVTFTAREFDLPPITAFAAIHFKEPNRGAIPRKPIPSDSLKRIQKECLEISDQPRLLLALLSDTGMRLSEALGLKFSDVKVNAELPHVVIRPHPWRRLKTEGSQRLVPLVGVSKLAAERLCAGVSGGSEVVFERYCDGNEVKANSASAALNKWLKPRVPEQCVVHSFRHSFRDRLRAVSCPTDVVDELGGWSTQTVGQRYGAGYSMEVKYSWMKQIV